MADGRVSNRFTMQFTAGRQEIDENGHVNNMIWLKWVQDLAGAHWLAAAPEAYRDDYMWFVTRHEIDYRGNVGVGDTVTATTFIPRGPRGARFDRRVDFHDAAGKLLVNALSTWAMLDRASGRLVRIPPQVAQPFRPFADEVSG